MEANEQAKTDEFFKEIRLLLNNGKKIEIPQELEIFKLHNLPDLSEWRKQ